MFKERTEQEMLSQAPLKLQFGGKEYEIPILTIGKSRIWREKLVTAVTEIGGLGISVANLGVAFVALPEKMADLVFAYDPELPKDTIIETATEEELAAAFSAIVSVALPLSPMLALMKVLWPGKLPGLAELGGSGRVN